MATGAPIPGGFPQYAYSVPFTDASGKLTRDALYLLQLLWQRTGGASGVLPNGTITIINPPAYLDSSAGDSGSDEPFFVPGVQGPPGNPGAPGPAVYLEAVDVADEPYVLPARLTPGGWFDEKGSGGTPGFAAGVDFTAGTTTSLTLSTNYGSQANLIVTFDGTWQGADQFSLSGKTLTFTAAIPVGTTKVFVKGFVSPT